MKQPSVYYLSRLLSFAFFFFSFSLNFFVQFSMSNLIPPTLILFYSLFSIIRFVFLSRSRSISRRALRLFGWYSRLLQAGRHINLSKTAHRLLHSFVLFDCSFIITFLAFRKFVAYKIRRARCYHTAHSLKNTISFDFSSARFMFTGFHPFFSPHPWLSSCIYTHSFHISDLFLFLQPHWKLIRFFHTMFTLNLFCFASFARSLAPSLFHQSCQRICRCTYT